jgi:hypothetical protein
VIDRNAIGALLGKSGGFVVEADDGVVGVVETPLFPANGGAPDYLVVRARVGLRARKPVVPAALVSEVDPNFRIVHLRGLREELARLPEHLPLAF